MTEYRINLHDCPSIDPATQAAILDADHTLLESELGCSFLHRKSLGAAQGLPCRSPQLTFVHQAMMRYPRFSRDEQSSAATPGLLQSSPQMNPTTALSVPGASPAARGSPLSEHVLAKHRGLEPAMSDEAQLVE